MRNAALAVLAILAIAGAMIVVGDEFSPRPAPTVAAPAQDKPDPWEVDKMRPLGSLKLDDGSTLSAVHVPAWPLATTCLVYSAPAGVSMRCDDDFPTRTAPPRD